MKTLRTLSMLAIAAAAFGASSAHADILFVDTNDQAIERGEVEALGRRYGQTVHIVKGDGPELEELFRRAEAGEIKLTTVVGSGHSSGTGFGGKNGSFYSTEEMVKKYPGAAGQVRHFIALGCYTAKKYAAAEWESRFPNATTVAGFNGLAPSGGWSSRFMREVYTAIMSAKRQNGGSEDTLSDRLASDPATVAALKRVLDGLSSVRITSSAFQLCSEFYDPKNRSVVVTREQVSAGEWVFRDFFNAYSKENPPADPHAPSALRIFYNDLQEYLGHATPEERPDLMKMKEQTIRLIYFGNVRKNFARTLKEADLKAANDALAAAGFEERFPTSPSEVASMSRQKITQLMNPFEYRMNDLPEGSAARRMAEKWKKEIVDLDVPFLWIDEPANG